MLDWIRLAARRSCRAATIPFPVPENTWESLYAAMRKEHLFMPLPDWTYHGVDGEETGVITVMTTQHGPTERERSSRKLRVITADWHGPLGWGYRGGSPSRTADALLADALQVTRDQVDRDLSAKFLTDIVSNLTEKFRLRRAAMLRWVRGYYAELGRTCPYALPDIP